MKENKKSIQKKSRKAEFELFTGVI